MKKHPKPAQPGSIPMVTLPQESLDVMVAQCTRLSELCREFMGHQIDINKSLSDRIEQLEQQSPRGPENPQPPGPAGDPQTS